MARVSSICITNIWRSSDTIMANPVTIDEPLARRMLRATKKVEREPQFVDPLAPATRAYPYIPPIRFRNDGNQVIPSFGVIETFDIEIVNDGRSFHRVREPTIDSYWPLLVNGPRDVSPQGFGIAQYGGWLKVRYGTPQPAPGDAVGIKDGLFSLSPISRPQFLVAGIISTSEQTMLVRETKTEGGFYLTRNTITQRVDTTLGQGRADPVDFDETTGDYAVTTFGLGSKIWNGAPGTNGTVGAGRLIQAKPDYKGRLIVDVDYCDE